MFSFIQFSSTIFPLEDGGRPYAEDLANFCHFEAFSLIGDDIVTGVPSRTWSKCLPGTAFALGVGMWLCDGGRMLVGVLGSSLA
jgi:hypothetical protein